MVDECLMMVDDDDDDDDDGIWRMSETLHQNWWLIPKKNP